MPKTKEILNKTSLKLSHKQNILLIISSIAILALVTYIIFQPLYLLIAPLLLVIVAFCLIPIFKSNTTYSKSYLRAHGFLAIVTIAALGYSIIQLIKDQMGIRCEGLLGSRASCAEAMWLSVWGISLFAIIPAAVLCIYGMITQARSTK